MIEEHSVQPGPFPEDKFRDAVWGTYYDSYYQERICEAISTRWTAIHLSGSIIVALAASGSAFAGLTLWSTPDGKIYWGTVAFISTVVAACQPVLNVPERVKVWTNLRRTFIELRLKLETFRQNLDFGRPWEEQQKQYEGLRGEFTKLVSEAPSDFIAGDATRKRIQISLNAHLREQGKI